VTAPRTPMSRAEAETAAGLTAARLGVELAEARRLAARLDAAKPGRLAALARKLPAAELAALAREEARRD
jgi:hypothetical protein